MTCCSAEFQWCRVLGSFWCTVRLHVPIFLLRVVSPDSAEQFAHNHHQIWECLARILDVDLNQCDAGVKASASLPLSMGGSGLRGAPGRSDANDATIWRVTQRLRVREPQRKPPGNWWGPYPHETWMILNQAVRRPGWQHEASSRMEQQFKDMLFAAKLSPSAQATIRSQGGPGAGMALMTCSTCRITTIPPQLFCVTLLRRLRLPLHLTVRFCRCGLPLDEFGHHRAACAQAGC